MYDNIIYPLRCKLVANNEPVELVMERKHFGMLLTRCSRFDNEVQERVMNASRMLGVPELRIHK